MGKKEGLPLPHRYNINPRSATARLHHLYAYNWVIWLMWTYTVASLGGVTGGGNWGCHHYFFPEKRTTFILLFSLHCHFYWFHSGVTPLHGVTRTFLCVRPRLSTTLCKFAHKKLVSFGCHPTDGGPPLPPPSNATGPIIRLYNIDETRVGRRCVAIVIDTTAVRN